MSVPPCLLYLHSSPLVIPSNLEPLAQLNIKHEISLLESAIEQSGKKVGLKTCFATIPNFRSAVTIGAQIIHFSGHGDSSIICFEEYGLSKHIPASDLKNIFAAGGTSAPLTKIVFVSSCNSEGIGNQFVDAGVPHVVAVKNQEKIDDKDCKAFAQQFYLALLTSKTVQAAFDIALSVVSSGADSGHFLLLPKGPTHTVSPFESIPGGCCVRQVPYDVYNGCDVPPTILRDRQLHICKVVYHFGQNPSANRCYTLFGEIGSGKTSVAEQAAVYMSDRKYFESIYFIHFSQHSSAQFTQNINNGNNIKNSEFDEWQLNCELNFILENCIVALEKQLCGDAELLASFAVTKEHIHSIDSLVLHLSQLKQKACQNSSSTIRAQNWRVLFILDGELDFPCPGNTQGQQVPSPQKNRNYADALKPKQFAASTALSYFVDTVLKKCDYISFLITKRSPLDPPIQNTNALSLQIGALGEAQHVVNCLNTLCSTKKEVGDIMKVSRELKGNIGAIARFARYISTSHGYLDDSDQNVQKAQQCYKESTSHSKTRSVLHSRRKVSAPPVLVESVQESLGTVTLSVPPTSAPPAVTNDASSTQTPPLPPATRRQRASSIEKSPGNSVSNSRQHSPRASPKAHYKKNINTHHGVMNQSNQSQSAAGTAPPPPPPPPLVLPASPVPSPAPNNEEALLNAKQAADYHLGNVRTLHDATPCLDIWVKLTTNLTVPKAPHVRCLLSELVPLLSQSLQSSQHGAGSRAHKFRELSQTDIQFLISSKLLTPVSVSIQQFGKFSQFWTKFLSAFPLFAQEFHSTNPVLMHIFVDRSTCDKHLLEVGECGTFLIRFSGTEGKLVISYLADEPKLKIKHHLVDVTGDLFFVKGNGLTFATLGDLIISCKEFLYLYPNIPKQEAFSVRRS